MTCLPVLQNISREAPQRSRPARSESPELPSALRSPGPRFELMKRGMDVAVSVSLLLVLSPLLAFCAAWIVAMGGRPVIYSQWRVGRHGYLFRVHKLRTMRSDAESAGPRFASDRDPRVLRGCHWMRRSHVDELPQLWNILRGDMSLVGPRPERPEMFETLSRTTPRFERRLAAAPGLTGLAQLRLGYTNNDAGARRKLAWDLRYLRRRSIRRDARLLIQTLPKFWDDTAC